MSKLTLSPKLSVPIDIVTETIAVLGIRGSGKTNTAVVLAEELLAHGQQVVVIDPTDVWWGIKSSADGQAPGYPVIVLGGRKAELPLGAADGRAIADVVVDHGASLILALRHFASKADMRRFITEFAEHLYYRKGQLESPTPLMLIIDEASLVVPQNVMGENARMVGSIQQLVRQGRSSGIGVTLIDQRPASVNKDVLTQLEALVCHRITSPQDRKALKDWVQQHDEHDRGDTFLAELASLPTGTAWVWSPGLLNIFKQVPVRARRTFDSSRTPKAGETLKAPTTFAPVDLEALRGQLAQTIEIARENDPKELRKEIAKLERQLEAQLQARESVIDSAGIEREIQRAIADEGARHERYRKVLTGEVGFARREASEILAAVQPLADRLDTLVARLDGILEIEVEEGGWVKPLVLTPPPTPKYHARLDGPVEKTRTNHHTGVTTRSSTPGKAAAGAAISKTSQKIVDAIGFFERTGVTSPSRAQVAAFAGATPGGSWSARLSEARTAGLIEDVGDGIQLTAAGRARVDGSSVPQTRRELHAQCLAKLSGKSRLALEKLLHVYPDGMSRTALAAECDATPGGSWSARLSEVRSPGFLVDLANGDVKASDLLFPKGLR